MKRAPWILVVLFALTVWLLPLLIIWLQAEPPKRIIKRASPKPGELSPQGPLILYTDTWPTREVINGDGSCTRAQGHSERPGAGVR